MNLNKYQMNAYSSASKSEKDDGGASNGYDSASKNPYTGNADVRAAAKALTSGGLLKVPEESAEPDGQESVYRRVAKFLLLIGVDEAAKVMPHLTEEQTEKIIPEIASIRSVSPDEASTILAEFQALVQRSREDGGVDTARTILEKAFGSEKAADMLNKSVPFSAGKPFEYLAEADSEKVGQLLKDESGAVRALVLSYLKPKVSAAVISALDEDDQRDVILRLAKLKNINPEVVRRVDQAMHEKMNSVVTEKSDHIDGRSALAQILKKMSPEAESTVLDTLSESDPDLGKDLRERLFTIDDVVEANDRFIQNTLRDMQDADIAMLIAGKADVFRNKILTNVSKTRGDSILEEESLRKPMRRSDCEKITSQFFSVLRRAWEEGKLVIKGRDDDMYA
jgi:flagellar motor switch protein FliG